MVSLFIRKAADHKAAVLTRLLAVARRQSPADMLLRNGKVIDLATGDIAEADIAMVGAYIAAVGKKLDGIESYDLKGLFVAPGLVDAHVHIESSMLRPREFARLVVSRGVTTVVANPHEIANVCGLSGIRFMQDDARQTPVDIFMTIPSCVPAALLAGSGASLGPEDYSRLLACPDVVALGEVMDFQGVITGEPRLLAELDAVRGFPVDGHAPAVEGGNLDAYAAAGITSDHECCTEAEVRDRLQRGMCVFLREGSAARNLQTLLPTVSCVTERFLALCTDDRDAADLLSRGSIDQMVRTMVAAGVSPLTALRMACLNPAVHYGLLDRGLIAPGRRADLVAFSSLDNFRPERVWHAGRLVAVGGQCVDEKSGGTGDEVAPWLKNTMHVDWSRVDFRISGPGCKMRVIGVVPGQLVTEQRILHGLSREGEMVADPERDLAKLAVIERHRATGRCGKGFVQGLTLRRGAMASSVAHDHHNLIVAGMDDMSMMTAARAVAESGGGQALAVGERLLWQLPLPVGGLMSLAAAEELVSCQKFLNQALKEVGCSIPGPFMTLSFLGLEVIPELKLTDFGLVHVLSRQLVPLFLED
ncbi:adenine deaminase [Syntrophotalea acetylenica]|uniref:adenine deaminase n=1 Tax=Syntrophotalea acetylenica TaxID=29542 RepID=UPI002A365A89|nr:adenine deaminase [Syntrophotalea acetylenica]MDY0262946.1 adenine deaminase [Syntrophotalea acetylenica]